MDSFKTFAFINESAKSDKHEKDVADYIDAMEGMKAERPKVSAAYADVKIEKNGRSTWLEVKMNHTDNLSNPRIFFDGRKWDTTYTTPAAKFAVEQINKSKQTKEFMDAIAKFSGIAKPRIPTNKGGLKHKDAVPLDVMKEYFAQPGINRYIMHVDNVDLGKLVTAHYLEGKAEPAHYMQAADDFYMVGNRNPLDLPKDIPALSGKGQFKIRISTRSQFYEVQAEIKIDKMPKSNYSALPSSNKKNPFA
jgi:hypothetical protein